MGGAFALRLPCRGRYNEKKSLAGERMKRLKYKALLLDIDGTLVVPGEPCIRPGVVRALRQAQQQGVLVILATGRTAFAAGKEVLAGLRPDYGIYANGAWVLDRQGQTVLEDRLTAQNMYTLVDFCEDYDYPLAFCYEDGYYVYVEYERMRDCYQEMTGHGDHTKDGEDQDRHLQSMPFAAFVMMPPEAVEAYHAKYPGLKFAPYSIDRYDVFKPENSKAEAAKKLLDKLGLSPEEVLAIGDGVNDLEMLELAGCSYAMANAPAQVQAAADHLAPDVRQEGVAAVVREVFLGGNS